MEYRYLSIPHNCQILENARLKPIYGEYLECYGFDEVPFEDLEFKAADVDFLAFAREAKLMREKFPGLEIRRFDIGPESDALRRAIVDSGNEILLKALDGGDILGVSIRSTRGDPLRFLPPYLVKKIVGEFDSGRFLVSSPLADTLGKLADFYRFSAAFDEGVITIKL